MGDTQEESTPPSRMLKRQSTRKPATGPGAGCGAEGEEDGVVDLIPTSPSAPRIRVKPASLLRVGRSKACSVAIDNPYLSGIHCHFKVEDGKLFIKDTSSNGTQIDGRPLEPRAWVRVERGQELTLITETPTTPAVSYLARYRHLHAAAVGGGHQSEIARRAVRPHHDDDDDDDDGDGGNECNDGDDPDAGGTEGRDAGSGGKRVGSAATHGDERASDEHDDDDDDADDDDKGSGGEPKAKKSKAQQQSDGVKAEASSATTGKGQEEGVGKEAASSAATAGGSKGDNDGEEMEENLLCCICRDVLHDAASALPCLHTFCAGCCSSWLQRNATCPECRAPVSKLRRNHLVNNLVDVYLKTHPCKRRDPDDIAALDAANELKRRGKDELRLSHHHHHDSDDDDDEGSDDSFGGGGGGGFVIGHGGFATGFGGLRFGFTPAPPPPPPRCRACDDAGSNVQRFRCPSGGSHMRCACCGVYFPFRDMPPPPSTTSAAAAVSASDGGGTATPTATPTTTDGATGATTAAATPPVAAAAAADTAAVSSPRPSSPSSSATAAPRAPATTGAGAGGDGGASTLGDTAAVTAGASTGDATHTTPSVTTTTTTTTTTTAATTTAGRDADTVATASSDTSGRTTAPAPPPVHCTLCARPFCNLFWTRGCFGPCSPLGGCLRPLQDLTLVSSDLTSFINRNPFESQVMRDYMREKNMNARDLLHACLDRYAAGTLTCPALGALSRTTPTCRQCGLRVFSSLAYEYRKAIPRAELPTAAQVSPSGEVRENCWYGHRCRTQYNRAHHAVRFNHVCDPR